MTIAKIILWLIWCTQVSLILWDGGFYLELQRKDKKYVDICVILILKSSYVVEIII